MKSKEFAEETKALAANQGVYNGFLATGLVYSIIAKDTTFALLFLICVAIAGIYDAYSTKKLKLFYIKGIPSIIVSVLNLI